MTDAERARGGIEALPPSPCVILVRPQMGENVGTAARAMLNFGLSELRLVAPQFGWPNAKAVAACSGAVEVLNRMKIYDTVPDAIADLQHVLVTTARPREMTKPVLDAREAAAEMRQQTNAGLRCGIMFGPERTGLNTDDILMARAIVTFSLNPAFPSLNLAQAVLLVSYEWFHSGDASQKEVDLTSTLEQLASHDMNQALLDHLVRSLEQTRFFRSPDKYESLKRALALIIERAQLRDQEAHLMHGVIKALRQD